MLERVPRAVKAVALAGLVTVVALLALFVAAVNSPAWQTMRIAFHTTYGSPAAYTQVVERRFGGRVRREEFRVWQDDRRRKVVQTGPRLLAGLTMFWDRPQEIAFAPGFSFVLKSNTAGRPRRFPPRPPWFLPLRRLRLRLGEEKLPDGELVRTVTAYAGPDIQMKLWVDRRYGFILRQERYDRTGVPFDVTVNRDIVIRPPGLDRALQVQLPADARVMVNPRQWRGEYSLFVLKKEAPFPFLLPQRLPRGYRLVHAEVLAAADRELVALRFARGRRGFTLFEYPGSDPDLAVPFEALARFPAPGEGDGSRIYRTVRSGIAAVAVGRLSPDEAEELFSRWQRIEPSLEKETADGGRTPIP